MEVVHFEQDRHKPNGAARIEADLFSQNKKVIYLEVFHLQLDKHKSNGTARIEVDLFSQNKKVIYLK